MRRARNTAGAALAILVLMPAATSAQSKDTLIELCGAQMKEAFGDVDVSFDKIRRSENRNFAFGEVQMADGTTRQLRCRVQRGKVRGVMFRNDGGNLGNRWSEDLPDGDFLLPEAEPETPEVEAETPETETETPEVVAETPEAETVNPVAETPPPEADGASPEQEAPTAEAEPDGPRFKRVPAQ